MVCYRQKRFGVVFPSCRLLAGLVAAFVATANVCSDTFTVDDDGPSDFDSIQDAIDAASDFDAIQVFAGTYTSDGDSVVNFKGKKLRIYATDGADKTFIDGENERRCVLCSTGEPANSKLQHFTLTNGAGTWIDLDGDGDVDNYELVGGAIYISNARPRITDCVFTGNSADVGGALYCDNGDSSILRCTFTNNSAAFGLAISFLNMSSPEIIDCVFIENYGGYSGTLEFLEGSDADVENCTFIQNQSVVGAAIVSNQSSIRILNCTFIGNLSNVSGAVHLSSGSEVRVTDCWLEGNSAFGDGGAISCSGGSPIIDSTTFVANNASEFGGAIRASNNCFLQVTNSFATGNRAYGGGAISCETGALLEVYSSDFEDNEATWQGNAIRSDVRSAATVTDSNFCGGEDDDHIEGIWIDKGGNSFTTTCSTGADIDGDGLVNGADLLILLAYWGHCASGSECFGDLDGNNLVDGADLLVLLSEWTG